MPRRITLLRHAAPEVRAGADPASWPLSAAGRSAASSLHLRARGSGVVSSGERKAVETVCLAAGVTADAVRIDHRFAEVRRDEPFDDDHRDRRLAWVTGRLDTRHTGWETPAEAAERFRAGVADTDGDVVVATHGMVLTAWLVALGVLVPGAPAGAYWTALGFPAVHTVTVP